MRIIYIMHSCFAVEIEDTLLLFDYFDKRKTPEVQFEGTLPDFSKYRKCYIFASHGHRDHFWLESLKWGMEYPDMIFFLGNDMRFNQKYLERNGIDYQVKERMITMRPGSYFEDGMLEVKALGSTDTGVSFLVKCKGNTIFHAGDLNDWCWVERKGDKKDEEYRRKMRDEFRKELEPLKEVTLDAAFVVLDPRLEDGYKNGMDYFIHHINAAKIFPMHMWKHYELIPRYKRELLDSGEKELADKVVEITHENQIFDI